MNVTIDETLATRLARARARVEMPEEPLLLEGEKWSGASRSRSSIELGRIALKTIRADIATNLIMLSRFKREVQLARKISGPNVCRIHELFVDDNGELLPDPLRAHAQKSGPALCIGSGSVSFRALLTMEFLEGITLADKLKSGPLPWREAQKISGEICDGLQQIHQAGIIHRDLKSRNIMLTSRNGSACVVLMDFGLAHEISTSTSATLAQLSNQKYLATRLTTTGAIIGTPDYMAPEQFVPGKELSPATDIYALDIVLYELATGKLPFPASTPAEAAELRRRRPSLASSIQPGLPHRFDEVICKCLEFDPECRYQSAKEVAEDLRSRPFSIAWLRRKPG